MNELITMEKFQEDEQSFLKALIETKGENLPAKVEDVLRIFEFTDWKAKAFKSLSDKLNKLDEQSEAYHSALRSGQNWGIAALYAQKRMGEITRDMPKGYRSGNQYSGIGDSQAPSKPQTLQTQGIDRHTYADAERIASHPEILDEAIEAAKKHNDIPTKTSVINRIRMEKAREDAEKNRQKLNDKLAKKTERKMGEYFDAIKIFKHAIERAIIMAERDGFDEASKNFVETKHQQVKDLMNKLEEEINE